MQRHRNPVTTLSLILALIFSLSPKRASAAVGDDDYRPVRLYATATAGPIGRVVALSGTAINSRTVIGEQFIWGGELIQATRFDIRVSLDTLGEVILRRGAMARISSARGLVDGVNSGDLLIASIVLGEIEVRLRKDAGGYVEARGCAFAASRGASFSIGTCEGEVVLKTVRGEVVQTPLAQPKYLIRPVGLGSSLSVRARGTRQVQFRVTDEHDRPVPDVPVVITLGGGGGDGTLGSGPAAGSSVTVTTSAAGIATTTFTAGVAAASASVTATIAGTTIATTVGVTTTIAAGFFTTTTLVIVGVVAAGAASAVAVRSLTGNKKEDIMLLPTNITPKP